MFIDYASPDTPTELNSDIAIIGAGPAGITLALELASSGKSIALLESGSTETDVETQSLNIGESTGVPYFPLNATRLRGLGGSTGHWSGWCGPLTEIDFVKRDWIPHSGWPIELKDLQQYYVSAQSYCKLGPYAYSPEQFIEEYNDFPEFALQNLKARLWHFSAPALHFGKEYKPVLELLPNVTVYTHANVTHLNLNETGQHIDSATLNTLSGKSGLIKAKQIIVAGGGIENPRLLLASNDVSRHGIGNDKDLVGRFFMEHTEAESAKIRGFNAAQMRQLKRVKTQAGDELGVAFCASAEKQKEFEFGNGAAFIAAPRLQRKSGWTAFIAFRDALLTAKAPKNALENLNRLMVDFDTVAGVFALRLRGSGTNAQIVDNGSIDVIAMAEQIPIPESRVTLSDNKDQFGKPQAKLHWQLAELDKRTIRYTMQLIASEISRLDIGRVQLSEWLQDDSDNTWSPRLRGGHHHMGTTRMADDPGAGVVDKNCKVHGVNNLYIAGSSVFPTGGYVNPTLTIVALSVRLADHLKKAQ